MMKWEQRLQAFIAGHAIAFGYAAALLLGAFLKYSYLPFLSADVKFLNAPWIDAIKQGGMGAVLDPELQFNYSPLSLYIWTAAAALLGRLNSYVIVKLVCLTSDAFLCVMGTLLVRALLPKQNRPLGTFLAFLLLWLNPVLLWNAAAWGQFDTGYAGLCVLAVWLLVKEKPVPALVAMGFALSMKLQAAFLLPLFLYAWFCGKKKFSLLWFLLVPGIWVLSGVPMAAVGESPLYAVKVYLGQTGYYDKITWNYPNLYALMGDAMEGQKQMVSGMFSRTGMAFAIALLGGAAVWMLHDRISLEGRDILLLGAWCVLCCVFLMPRMHERYGMAGEVLLLCWALCLCRPRGFVYVILSVLPVMSAYAYYLFKASFFSLQLGGAMNLVLFLLLTWELVRALRARRMAE